MASECEEWVTFADPPAQNRVYTISSNSDFILDVLPSSLDMDDSKLSAVEGPSFVSLDRSKLVINADSDYYQIDHDEEPLVNNNNPDSGSGYGLPPNVDLPEPDTFSARERTSNNALSHVITLDHQDISTYHCHPPKLKQTKKARNQLLVVSCLCGVFMVAEVLGGVLSNSLALVTDATHMASDLSSFIISLIAIWVAKKDPTSRLSFGYHRAEVIGALISVFIIWITTVVLVYMAVDRVLNPDYEIKADEMIITAGLGVAFNIVMGIVLHGGLFTCSVPHTHSHFGSSHGHSHGNSHHDNHPHNFSNDAHINSSHPSVNGHGDMTSSHQDGKEKRNINVRAAMIHVIGDLIQSVGVLIAAYVIKYKPEYKIADPLCTFVFSILVLFTTVTILRDTCLVFMEGVPRGFDIRSVKKDLKGLHGVKAVHSLHVWALTMDKNALATHLAVDGSTDMDTTVKSATSLLRKKYNVLSSTVQVESFDEDKMSSCDQCIGPKGL